MHRDKDTVREKDLKRQQAEVTVADTDFYQSVHRTLLRLRCLVMTLLPSGARWQMTSQHRESDVTLAV